MKREVAFFKDHRATSSKALLATLRALGMSDAEIIEALKAAQQRRAADLTSCVSQASNLNHYQPVRCQAADAGPLGCIFLARKYVQINSSSGCVSVWLAWPSRLGPLPV